MLTHILIFVAGAVVGFFIMAILTISGKVNDCEECEFRLSAMRCEDCAHVEEARYCSNMLAKVLKAQRNGGEQNDN